MKKKYLLVFSFMTLLIFVFSYCKQPERPIYSYSAGRQPTDNYQQPGVTTTTTPTTGQSGEGKTESDIVSKENSKTPSHYSSNYGSKYKLADNTTKSETGNQLKNVVYQGGENEQEKYSRKIIRNANVQIEIKSKSRLIDSTDGEKIYNDVVKTLKKKCEEFNGYIQGYNETQGKSRKEGTIVFRLPASKFDDFLEIINSSGSLTSESISTQDVSAEYYDTEARLRNARTTEQKLLEIKNMGKTVDEVLRVQSELSNVLESIERMEQQIRMYDNLVGFCTITLSINGPSILPMKQEGTFFDNLANSFYIGIEALINTGKELSYFLAIIFPWLFVFFIIFWVTFIIVRKNIKKKPQEQKTQ